MDRLSRALKLETFNSIISNAKFLGRYEDYDGIIQFLNRIWQLSEMDSTDPRFENAESDAFQHLVNNSDWSMQYLFVDRLNLIDGDEGYFIGFIEAIVNPMVRENKSDINFYVSLINSSIKASGFQLVLTDYIDELPFYRFKNIQEWKDLPIDILPNKIPIYAGERNKDEEVIYPSFYLKYIEWDDFGRKTRYGLSYNLSKSRGIYIGEVKIMARDVLETQQVLMNKFDSLTSNFCSMGQSKVYYSKLKEELKSDYYSFLLALRDVAIFPKIYEQFENNETFKLSLLRYNEIERLARTIRFELGTANHNDYFKFNFIYQPPYASNEIVMNFDFDYNKDYEHRIYALIGKNGTGKTKILTSLAKNLSEKEPNNFKPSKPVYGKIFTVSYSFFDKFEIPSSSASFNYVYCGLKKSSNEWKTEEDLVSNFYNSANLIKLKNLERKWYWILKNFISTEILNIMFNVSYMDGGPFNIAFEEQKFNSIRAILSSGQSIILYLVSEILAQIRFDSLILFDEPETHLHPNAISALMNTLYQLVKDFESFCIIATHSPIIIQEIPARNIFIIEREEDHAYVRYLERESLGENLTVITQDIFWECRSSQTLH